MEWIPFSYDIEIVAIRFFVVFAGLGVTNCGCEFLTIE